MSSGVFNANRLTRVVERLSVLADINALEPLATRLELVIVESNRHNLLNGLDGDGNKMAPTTYRGGFAVHQPDHLVHRRHDAGAQHQALQGCGGVGVAPDVGVGLRLGDGEVAGRGGGGGGIGADPFGQLAAASAGLAGGGA